MHIYRSQIHDLSIDALTADVAPASMPGVMDVLSTLLPRARTEELKSRGVNVAVRAAFFPRGSSAFDEVPHGEAVLNDVKAAAAKMPDPLVLVFGMASSESGNDVINEMLADLRAITMAGELRRELGSGIEVRGVGIYALQTAGFALDSTLVKQFFRLALLPRSPRGAQDTRDTVSNQGVIVVVVSRKASFFVLLNGVIDRRARA